MEYSTCELCGRDVAIGEWPYCPHGFGNNLQKPMEPHTDEMLTSEPREFRTIGEKVKFMDQHAIVPSRERGRGSHPDPLPSSSIRNAVREVMHELRR